MSETAVTTWEIHFYVSNRRTRRKVEHDLEKLKHELTEIVFDFLFEGDTLSCMFNNFRTMLRVIDVVGRESLSSISVEVSDQVEDDGATRTISSRATLGWEFCMDTGSIRLGER